MEWNPKNCETLADEVMSLMTDVETRSTCRDRFLAELRDDSVMFEWYSHFFFHGDPDGWSSWNEGDFYWSE